MALTLLLLQTVALLVQPRTIVLHKPRKVFGSFLVLVTKESNTPYSDASKTSHNGEKIKTLMNAFMMFSLYERKKIIEVQSDSQNTEIFKRLGRKWKELSDSKKHPYIQEAERFRLLHLQEYPGYKYQTKSKLKVTPPKSFIDTQLEIKEKSPLRETAKQPTKTEDKMEFKDVPMPPLGDTTSLDFQLTYLSSVPVKQEFFVNSQAQTDLVEINDLLEFQMPTVDLIS